MSEPPAIFTEGLTKVFGETVALDGLDLQVAPGQVFAFLGPNGSGKSTTIRILVDLLRPTAGRASVLGLDPRANAVEVRARIGYLPGDFTVDGRQSASELLTYLANLRGGVDSRRIALLAERLDLDVHRPIAKLSRGNRQKVGLIQAMMHEPELLILDEPTSGLDPFYQHEFVSMMRDVAAMGRTVFLSSHVMSEVQHVADQVGIIRNGKLALIERVDALRDQASRRVEIVFAEPVSSADFVRIPGVHDCWATGSVLTCRLTGSADALVKAAARRTVVTLSVEEPDLDELFFGYYQRSAEMHDAA